jgi:hypothetical protein
MARERNNRTTRFAPTDERRVVTFIGRAVIVTALMLGICGSATASESWSCYATKPQQAGGFTITADGAAMIMKEDSGATSHYQLLANDKVMLIAAIWSRVGGDEGRHTISATIFIFDKETYKFKRATIYRGWSHPLDDVPTAQGRCGK